MKIDAVQNKYAVVLMQPDNYVHSAALAELAETLLYAFDALGLDFVFYINQLSMDAQNILLGAHLLDEASIHSLPENVIIYNSEQLVDSSSWINESYLTLLKQRTVWDYSRENIDRLAARGIGGVQYAPVGYMPQLTRIPFVEQDIDVLFYGLINERRKNILEALIKSGLRVEFLSDVYREERDAYIARAKVVLNMHYYEEGVFETVRVSYLLANEKAVVAEYNGGAALDLSLGEAVCAVPYDALVATCFSLVNDNEQRVKLAKKGFEFFSRMKETEILRPLLGLPPSKSALPELPAILNLGSGKDWQEVYFNVDINESMRPDAIVDISDPSLFEKTYETMRFGQISLYENLFDRIIANDVLEHIRELKTAMTNCLALLKPGGIFQINVPYDLSFGAWQDPTHVRAFNENSWFYYTEWFWYMGWTECRFDVVGVGYVLSPIGEEMREAGNAALEISCMPRAINSMNVRLRKRYLQEAEKMHVQPVLQRPWDVMDSAG